MAYRLSASGWDVTLIEKNTPGHPRSPSGGESRLLRCSHGGDREHARLAWRARSLWRELEADSGRELFVETGLLYLASRDDGWEARSVRALTEEGIPAEWLPAAAAAKWLPDVNVTDLSHVLLEPGAGILRAKDAVHGLVDGALGRGARLVTADARPAAHGVEVDDRILDADVVIWACGPWLAALFPDIVPVRVTRQEVFFFAADSRWRTPPVPAWIDQDAELYGLGDLDGHGFKVALDADGETFDPEDSDRMPTPAKLGEAREYVARRFPSLRDSPVIGSVVCCYATTEDQEFIIDRLPGNDGVWIMGGDSGHGFKHAPALAEYVEGILEGTRALEDRWRLRPRTRRVSTPQVALR